MCVICRMPNDRRIEVETAIKEGVSVRKLAERFNVDKGAVMTHKNKCMSSRPNDAGSKLAEMAVLLEKKGDYKGAASVYAQLVQNGDPNQEDVYGYLGRIAPRLCPECKRLILEG